MFLIEQCEDKGQNLEVCHLSTAMAPTEGLGMTLQ